MINGGEGPLSPLTLFLSVPDLVVVELLFMADRLKNKRGTEARVGGGRLVTAFDQNTLKGEVWLQWAEGAEELSVVERLQLTKWFRKFNDSSQMTLLTESISWIYWICTLLFIYVLFYSIRFYSIPFYSHLFLSILVYYIIICSIVFYSIPFYYILFYSIPFYSHFFSILVCSV